MTTANALTVLKQNLMTDGMKTQIKAALPKHVSVDKFLRTTMTLVSENPDLVKADRNSLMTSIMSVASLGLMPESFLGECYVIPYKGQCSVQVGYKGLLVLARRSGDIANVAHGVVYEKDDYAYEQGDNSSLVIKPYMGNDDPGAAVFAWCVVTLKDGSKIREVMKAFEVEKIRQASPSKNSPAWRNSWGEMARKTVVKRALKTAPRSTELAQALAVDDTTDAGGSLQVVHGQIKELSPPEREVEKEVAAKPKRKSRAKALVEEAKKTEEPRGPLGDNDAEPPATEPEPTPPAPEEGDPGVAAPLEGELL